MPSYLILGAGAFGASTALHLKRSKPGARVTVMDRFPFPSPGSAVHDVNKIIRSDYGDARYMRIALEGMDLWRDDPNMSPFWHNSGVLWSCTHEEGKMFVENYRAVLGFSPGERLLSEDVKERFDGIYSGTNFDGVEEWFYNPMGGWADTAGALNRVLELAVQVGVQYISDAVKALLFDSTGKCTGVRSDEGRVHEADSVVLCTGAYTAKLLADSAPTWKNLQVGSRMVTAAACMCLFTISNEDREKFKDCPLICHDKGAFPAESIPPGTYVKVTQEISFTNFIHHEASGQKISVPNLPESDFPWTTDVPDGLKLEIEGAKRKIYGDYIKSLEPHLYRMCWDAITPSMDWIICPHPHARNLFLATGASFHGAKFLPVIGKYVTKMLDGELGNELRSLWGWDKPESSVPVQDPYIPERDLKDIR